MISRRGSLSLVVSAFAAPFVARAAGAQAWPSRFVRIVVPFTAGGATDTVARLLAAELSQA
jgi:tripartite-type tricarboxylate transporter receptor subunit TctC